MRKDCKSLISVVEPIEASEGIQLNSLYTSGEKTGEEEEVFLMALNKCRNK